MRRKTILLVHDSTTSDYSWIEAMKIFLEKWGGFKVFVDFIEIPRSRHKDPLLWYTESMETADSVAVVSPPSLPVGGASISTDQRSAIYHHTFDLALELLAMRISRRLKLKERDVLQQFVVLQTGESSAIPDVCSSFTRFLVPEEFSNLISYIGEDGHDSGAAAAANNRSFTFADCLVQRWIRRGDKESTLMDSFRMIHQHLRQRNNSSLEEAAAAAHVRPTAVDDAQHVAECSSLLSTQNEEDRERKRQQLDREFGSGIVSLANLPTLG